MNDPHLTTTTRPTSAEVGAHFRSHRTGSGQQGNKLETHSAPSSTCHPPSGHSPTPACQPSYPRGGRHAGPRGPRIGADPLPLWSHAAWTAVTAAAHLVPQTGGEQRRAPRHAGNLQQGLQREECYPLPLVLAMGAAPRPSTPSPVQAPGPGHARLPAGSWRADTARLVWDVLAGGRAQAGAAGLVTGTKDKYSFEKTTRGFLWPRPLPPLSKARSRAGG